MSSSTPASSSFSQSSRARMLAQTTLDAEYEDSVQVISYLQPIQKGKVIQPFGCMLAVDEKSFNVIAFSENAPEMLTMISHAVPNVDDPPRLEIGTNVWSLFTDQGATALHKALGSADVSLLNPILVQCKTSGKPFHAIVHRASGYLVVDFEPVNPTGCPATTAGALPSYKLAAKAISEIQSLPGGSIEVLCNTVVKEILDLTGYDRVMAYKFHEDDRGEVFAEITKPGLEPYLGLHYPATDIPQVARFLFMENKVRMICDCRAKSIKVIEDEVLPFDISLCGSALRAPHSCHLQYMENMNSRASLVMAVVVNENDDGDEAKYEKQQQKKKLWGLLICHHESPRYVPFPLRHACDLLAHVFAVHVSKELELEKQLHEKSRLRMKTVLEGYSKDIPFWLGPDTAEIRWAGEKNDSSNMDDCRKMHPRSSFKEIVEVIEMKRLFWTDYEMDAIHSLQTIHQGTLNDAIKQACGIVDLKLDMLAALQAGTSEMALPKETATFPILAVDANGLVNEWSRKAAELTGLRVDDAIGRHIITLVEESSIPVVQRMLYLALQGKEDKGVQFEVQTHGTKRDDGRVVLAVNACASRDIHGQVVGVRFVAQDITVHKLPMDMFARVEGDSKAIIHNRNPLIPRTFGAEKFGWGSKLNAAMTKVTKWHRNEEECFNDQELRSTYLNEKKRKHIHVPDNYDHQINKILADLDQDSITKKSSYLDLELAEFVLQDVVDAASKEMIAYHGKGIRVSCNLPERLKKQSVYGDCVQLQQILSDVLYVAAMFSPIGGSVEISSKHTNKRNLHLIDLELRITHQVLGVSAELMPQMLEEYSKEQSEERLGLIVSRILLRLMNGDVQHLREAGVSTFILTVKLASAPTARQQ